MVSMAGSSSPKINFFTEQRTLSGARLPRRFTTLFVPLRIPLRPLTNRALVLPVLKALHPAAPLLPSSSNNVHHHKRSDSRHPSILSAPASRLYTTLQLVFALAGTAFVCLLPLLLPIFLYFYIKAHHSFLGPTHTLAFTRNELAKIWRLEVASGRYPSVRGVGNKKITFGGIRIDNPAVPGEWASDATKLEKGSFNPVGHSRRYLDPPRASGEGHPTRPVEGATLDLDVLMDHCDFSLNKYVPDCLRLLRQNAGLEQGVVVEDFAQTTYLSPSPSLPTTPSPELSSLLALPANTFSMHVDALEHSTLLPASAVASPTSLSPFDASCPPSDPHLFHIFWAGPFTDKPYMSALSFLYTQNLDLSSPLSSPPPIGICRPQLWIWINPGPASSLPNPNAEKELRAALAANEWSRPLLHERFSEAIQFKLWNTTEQLDAVGEEMHGWRGMELFKSHGWKYAPEETQPLFDLAGSVSSSSYDRLSVVLSDMARFLLTYRYGGIYLDADTILLRSWTELFNTPQAFAYRWSRLPLYNTAVLKMSKGSPMGSFVIRTARTNGMDFHPMTVWEYVEQAGVEGLLRRLPDALFDTAWLNIENYQREKPASPNFKAFEDFFSPPSNASEIVSFDTFFRGAFSYHYHNFWWLPFDPLQNYPALGPRFSTTTPPQDGIVGGAAGAAGVSWATMMKRTFESYVRGERGNLYGERIDWE